MSMKNPLTPAGIEPATFRYEFMFIFLNFSGVVYSLLYDLTFIGLCLVIFFLQKINQLDSPMYQIYFILE